MNFEYMKVIKPEINVGDREKKIRSLTGSVLVFISIFTASILLLLVGLILIATGYFGRCPAYAALNRSTVDKAPSVSPESTAAPESKTEAAKPAAKKTTASKAKKPAKKTAAASKAKTTTKKATATKK